MSGQREPRSRVAQRGELEEAKHSAHSRNLPEVDSAFDMGLAHFETYRTERGTYLFPRHDLQERTSGYWVTGAYMGLKESRRPKRVLELESTFWMLRVKKLAHGGAGQN